MAKRKATTTVKGPAVRARSTATRTPPRERERPPLPQSTAVAAREATKTAMLRPGLKIKVRALRMGYYDHVRRRVDDVFIYTMGPRETRLPSWVERVAQSTPERVTTGVQELREKHDEILRDRMPASGTPLVNDELTEGEKNPLGE